MDENKSPNIGLSWAPNLSSLLGGGKKASDKNAIDALGKVVEPELVDGLFVPPREPKKLNKMFRKQLKDSSGKSWYVEALHS